MRFIIILLLLGMGYYFFVNGGGQMLSTAKNTVQTNVTETINNEIQGSILQAKDWLYNSLKPIFPWLFIIFFLLFFAILKSLIPFSHIVIIQLPIVFISYVVAFLLFFKLHLTHFAMIGSIWFVTPIVLTILILYFFRKTLIPKLTAINDRFVAKMKNIIISEQQ